MKRASSYARRGQPGPRGITLGDLVRLADLDVSVGQGYAIARPAEPWPTAAPEATQACVVAFTAALSVPRRDGFERVVALLAGADDRSQLLGATDSIADELDADHVELVPGAAGASGQVTQVLIDDEAADPAESDRLLRTGHRSLLRVPMTSGDSEVGALEIYRCDHRPWSRHEIRRARMIAYQLDAALTRLAPRRRARRLGLGRSRISFRGALIVTATR